MDYQPQLTIDLDQVNNNIKLLTKDKKPCLMVKANTYHVLENIGPLVDLGYDFFGVSTLEEAVKIVEAFAVDVLIVTPLSLDEIKSIDNQHIRITVTDINTLNHLNHNLKFHIKIDTGMGRIGFNPHDIETIVQCLKANHLTPEGIFSHLACASDQETSLQQITTFKNCIDQFKTLGINPEYIHIQNSLAASLYQLDWCNMVRPGIGIWGYAANQQEALLTPVKPALKLSVAIAYKKHYQGKIGYDHLDYVDGEIATIKMGYNDGLMRSLRSYHLPQGKIVGNICMCQAMVLLDQLDAREIEIFNQDSLYQLVDYAQCSVYEFLCGLSYRIKRIIKRKEE